MIPSSSSSSSTVASIKQHQEKEENPSLSGWDDSEIDEVGGDDFFDWSKPAPLRMNVLHQHDLLEEEVNVDEKSPVPTSFKRNGRPTTQRKTKTILKVEAETFSSTFRNLLQTANKRDVLRSHGSNSRTNNSSMTTPQQRQFTSKLIQIVSRNGSNEAASALMVPQQHQHHVHELRSHQTTFCGRPDPNLGENLCVTTIAVPSVLKKEKEGKENQEKHSKPQPSNGTNKPQGLPSLQAITNRPQASMTMFTTTTLTLPFDIQKVASSSSNNNNQSSSSNRNNSSRHSLLDEEEEEEIRKDKYDRHKLGGGEELRIFLWPSNEHLDTGSFALEPSLLKSMVSLPAKLCKKDPLIQASSSPVPSHKYHARETSQLVGDYAMGSIPAIIQSNYGDMSPNCTVNRLRPIEVSPKRSPMASSSVVQRSFPSEFSKQYSKEVQEEPEDPTVSLIRVLSQFSPSRQMGYTTR